MNRTTLIPSLLIAGSLLVGAADSKPLNVGAVIPDAALRTAQEDELRLRDAVKHKPAVLIFYRGGWCPYCTLHLSALAGVVMSLISVTQIPSIAC